jgi:hypothetical protein
VLDNSVFDWTLEVGFLSFLISSLLLLDLKKLLNQSLVLTAGFGEFVSQIQSSK